MNEVPKGEICNQISQVMEKIKAPHNFVYAEDANLQFLVRQSDNEVTTATPKHTVWEFANLKVEFNKVTTYLLYE